MEGLIHGGDYFRNFTVFSQLIAAARFTLHFDLASVVLKVDNTIHWINLYPVDNAIAFPNTYSLDSD